MSVPDIGPVLDPGEPRPYLDGRLLRFSGLDGDVALAHASLEECVVDDGDVQKLDLRGASLIDVDIRDLRAVSVGARDSTVRRLRITGGRIGTLDLTDARIAELEVRDARIDYVTLAGARAIDVRFTDCTIRTLDVPQAEITRVAFTRCRADEVDPRGMRAADLDLRGLDVGGFLDVLALRGATLSTQQVELLARAFATAAGIQVTD